MQITITRETKKAALITNGERTGWVQKRWIKDGQVSDKVFEKAATEYESREAERAAQAAWRNAFHAVPVARETEKAFAFEAHFTSGDGEQEVTRLLWFPKSVCQGFEVPGWMIEKKVAEVMDSFPSCANAFLNPEDARILFD